MVAYSFQKRFAEPIESGFKTHTIRAERKRHARPGEAMQLYCGMRTKHCRKIIADPVCTAVHPIQIAVSINAIEQIKIGDWPLDAAQRSRLAKADGFADLEDMHQFWVQNHGQGVFIGVIVFWGEVKI